MLPKASALRGALVARSYVQASTLNISTCAKEDDRQAVGPRHSPFEIRPEKFKIHQTTQPLERVALGRKLLQTLLDIEEPGLTPHPTPSDSDAKSSNGGNRCLDDFAAEAVG